MFISIFSKTFKILGLYALILTTTFAFQEDTFAQRKSRKGWLGVSVQELTPSMRKDFDLGNRNGLLITHVFEDSPADDARLWEDDIILKYDGQIVELADEFSKMVRNTTPETKVSLQIWRDEQEKQVEVIIGRRRSRSPFVWSGDNVQVFWGRPVLGVQVHSLNADLAQYFEVKENDGVLIVEVTEDSPAEDAGLRAGDIITKIDNESISEHLDILEVLEDYEDGDVVSVEYIRKGKIEKVDVELEGSGLRNFYFGKGLQRGVRLHIPEPPQIHYLPKIQLDVQPRHKIRHAPKTRIELKRDGRVI